MPYYCTVPRCTSMAGKARDVSFHQFPRDAALAEHWNLVLKRGKPYTKYSKVCSRHFTAQDYTCTTVGKNKGHWRTLRKDAVPSQNLPDEAPMPCRTSMVHTDGESPSDQQIQQQLAHAVYVQTMLAMHAASAVAALPRPPASNSSDGSHTEEEDSEESAKPKQKTPPHVTPEPQEERGWHATDVVRDDFGNLHPVVTRSGWYHQDTITDSNPSIRKHNRPYSVGKPTRTAFKCEDCSKCFKDPDVFLLHKRWHTNGQEKPDNSEMLSRMLQPVKDSDNRSSPAVNFDPLNLEHQILMAMRMNMESYIKNMVSIGEGQKSDVQSEVSLSEESVLNGSETEDVHAGQNSDRLMKSTLNSGG